MVQDFLEEMDEDGDGLLQNNELFDFIDHGINNMSADEQQEYASRGELQAAVVDLFLGVARAVDEFHRQQATGNP